MYYKAFAHMLLAATKSQDLQLASWKPRRASAVSSSLKTRRLKIQEELRFLFEFEGRRKDLCPSSVQSGRSCSLLLVGVIKSPSLFIYSGPERRDEAHPHWGGQSTIQMLLSRNILTDKPRIILIGQVAGHLRPSHADVLLMRFFCCGWQELHIPLVLFIPCHFCSAYRSHSAKFWVVLPCLCAFCSSWVPYIDFSAAPISVLPCPLRVPATWNSNLYFHISAGLLCFAGTSVTAAILENCP